MTEIVKADQQPLEVVRVHYETMTTFVANQMQSGIDFGVIPGTSKPTLLKPGAEKLCRLLGLSPQFQMIDSIVDFDKPLFYYHYQCSLYQQGQLVGQAEGSCNSYEKKYRYRKAELTCPSCGQPTVGKGKKEYGGGYFCSKKKGGCGAKFNDNDERIISQDVGLVDNPEIFDQINTIQKMAQKRALVAVVLCAAGASKFFTQDREDSIVPSYDQAKQVKYVTQPKSTSTNNSPDSSAKPKTREDWYAKGVIDASNGEAVKYPNVKPYVDGFYSETKGRELRKLEKDMRS